MEQAWLESLSEDWVSQPRSSGSPAPSLPSFSNSTSDSSNASAASSRIPIYNPQKQSWTAAQDVGHSPLSERSTNENIATPSQRALRQSSKLREITNGNRGRRISRTLSTSTTQSVQYHTMQHKSASLSPKRGDQETPEWKRRLLHGEVAYGEQRDLFSPAGLENIFRPPPPRSASLTKLRSDQDIDENSVMLPSSPPPYNTNESQERVTKPTDDEAWHGDAQIRQQPRAMNYRLASQGGSDFSVNDLSQSSVFQPAKASFRHNQGIETRVENMSESGSSVARVHDPARTVSGQSDMRNEELSPIYIARHNTIDGTIDYAALNLPPDELKRRLDIIRESIPPQSNQDGSNASDVLSVDVTVETDDFAHNGRFVNLRRGGQSEEGSFQKRMLSSSSLSAIDESAMLPEESMQASTPTQLPNIRKTRASNEYHATNSTPISPAELHTPRQSPKKESKSSSGSPLKIFGTYDTFTNQKLLRRLSQFEGDFENQSGNETSDTVQESANREMNDAFVAASSPEKVVKSNQVQRKGRNMSSFGAGELDSFQFIEGVSYNSAESPLPDEKESLSLPTLDRNKQNSFKFQLEPSPDLSEDAVTHHRARFTSTMTTTRQITSSRKAIRPLTGISDSATSSSSGPEDLKTPRKRNGDSEGKRLPKTPLKDPTPKRRRTLHEAENISVSEVKSQLELDSLRETHQQMQSVVGRKRKDARHGDSQQAANPKVLAMRQILRPRTPTPSQRSSQQHEYAPSFESNLTSSEQAKLLQEQKLAQIQAELDSTGPLKISAALGVGQHMFDDSRKGSVTTQDFLDEAKKIMAGIRGKTRPRSGLTSLEESESENDKGKPAENGAQDDDLEDSYQESTKEPFSRPPSREGKPLPRLPLKQEDPALLDHLRKYQERSDMDGVIASSMRSIAMARDAIDVAKEIDRRTDETIHRASTQLFTLETESQSEPPNMRISENPDVQRKRKHSTSSIRMGGDDSKEVEFPSHGSNGSSSQSTARSIPTGSSRGSDSRRVIAPHSVSHLIPEQLAGMVFDQESKKWVKSKNLRADGKGPDFLLSDETEDDPFGDIPDLSVDETQELQRIKEVAAKRKQDERAAMNEDVQSNGIDPVNSRSGPTSSHTPSMDPANNAQTNQKSQESESSKAAVSSDRMQPVTRQPAHPPQIGSGSQRRKSVYTEAREQFTEVEKEISIHEDRINPSSPQKRRNVTISFSSPLASVIQASGYDADGSFELGADDFEEPEKEVNEESGNDSLIITKKEPGSSQRTASAKIRTAFRSTSRRLSLGGHKFSARPVSRIDEQDEDSIDGHLQERQQRSISIVLSTPVPARKISSVVLATPRPSHEIGTLTLTPLSEFTVHQADVSLGLDVSYVAQGHRYVLGNDSKRTLSLSIKELVEKLTEVEPYEPFWEHIKELDLKDKRLTNLHKLDEFCGMLEELDVSHNQVGHLNGVPSTIRHLRITHNCLTDLAAWNHLHNLQYIDVSNNDLESLSPFKSLVHLRGLRADNNRITSLDGVSKLDGLLSLRLRGNAIRSIDFSGSKLQRLTDLDLKDNHVGNVRNLQDLRSLSSLNLEDNDMCNIYMHESEVMPTLRYLKLSGNNIESVDVGCFPNLRLVYLDRNRLGTVSGLLKTKYLDSLSMREQHEGAIVDPSFLSEAFEVRKLFLSGNFLGRFTLQANYLNLQYLELANCGLEALPDDFGQMVQNIRVLNLNFNALKDIKPLLGIVRLKKLHLAGNRLGKLRSTTFVLAHFPTMTLADLRSNPLTLGFYPPVTENRMIVRDMATNENAANEPFTLGKADRTRDDKYAACLDMETRMLRRVYEVMILSNCSRLKTLDGLSVERSLLGTRDKVWEALAEAGVFSEPSRKAQPLKDEEEVSVEEVAQEPRSAERSAGLETERWQVEDSFA